jgi:hypothetical protein
MVAIDVINDNWDSASHGISLSPSTKLAFLAISFDKKPADKGFS